MPVDGQRKLVSQQDCLFRRDKEVFVRFSTSFFLFLVSSRLKRHPDLDETRLEQLQAERKEVEALYKAHEHDWKERRMFVRGKETSGRQ